jgi:hypothetical protein
MFCPECKAEYRQGFTRCTDCDVELVESYAEAVRHPIAKKVEVGDEYGARLWHGKDPHFYVGLLGSLWNKKVACYGTPEYPPIRDSMQGLHRTNSDSAEFEVWVSKEDLPLAKWILDSDKEEYEKGLPEQNGSSAKPTPDDVSPETSGVCPLCFGEFTTAYTHCPNCEVPLNSPHAEVAAEDLAWQLCDFVHPKFLIELRKALKAASIPFNNANISYGDVISAWSSRPNYGVLVLKRDFKQATQVMSQILQHWEFEPSAGFLVGRDSLLPYGLELAARKGWDPEDISALVWSDANIGLVGGIGLALQEHRIPYRVDTEQLGTARILVHPEDEARARELVQEVREGPRPE